MVEVLDGNLGDTGVAKLDIIAGADKLDIESDVAGESAGLAGDIELDCQRVFSCLEIKDAGVVEKGVVGSLDCVDIGNGVSYGASCITCVVKTHGNSEQGSRVRFLDSRGIDIQTYKRDHFILGIFVSAGKDAEGSGYSCNYSNYLFHTVSHLEYYSTYPGF